MKKSKFWEDYGYVARGRLRQMVVKHITRPITPKMLSKEMSIHLSEASRVFIELSEQGLAECLTPKSKTGRVYKLSGRGEKVKAELLKSDVQKNN